MIVKENEPLSKHTTFRMGGVAKHFYIPESREDLIVCLEEHNFGNFIIGGGSNLLINDNKIFDNVLSLTDFNKEIRDLGDGRFYFGASNRLQHIIKYINEKGYGGIEYLYSVPGLVGGAVFMNAGRGKEHKQSISDYIEYVEVLKEHNIYIISKDDCHFEYRTSIFQKENMLILGVCMNFPSVSQVESTKRIQDRLEHCKLVQDSSLPNFGTVFSSSNTYIMALVKRFHLGYKKGCTFSSKTKNWMLKGQNGTFQQALKLILRVQKMHRLIGSNCKIEVHIWE